MTPNRAYTTLTEHPHYRYRGCAPDPDQPTRAQGNLAVPVDAWGPYTEDGGELTSVRNARQAAARANDHRAASGLTDSERLAGHVSSYNLE